mgnify:FL=1
MLSMKPVLKTLMILAGIAHATLTWAQESARETLEGSWEGPLVIGRDNMNLAFTFSVNGEDFTASLTSSGLGIYGMPADTVMVDGRRITIRIPRLDLEFTGTTRMSEAGDSITRIDGDWFQHSEMVPVVLVPVESPTF